MMFKLALIYLLSAVVALAVVDEPTLTRSIAVEWPQAANVGGTVSLDLVPELTNAERLKRGLSPKSPTKLYEARHMRLAPRASIQAVPQARSANNRQFNLQGCTDSPSQLNNLAGGSLPYGTPVQEVVDWCANNFVNYPYYTPTWFAVVNWYNDVYYCYVSAVPTNQYNSNPVSCGTTGTTYNFAVYFPA